ncbi:MAG: ferritin-like domain-containing protein [Elusimicrobiaceae bacterium]|nr:ferritin-like domain-containing protein [Elusimicrobiaceae bacterium]
MTGRKIVAQAGLDVEEVIQLLNQAFSDEWLAYYQYWAGAQVASGLMAPSLRPELEEHANEELDHAKKLAKRIIELGGTPVLSPEEWYKQSTCGYLVPKNHDAANVLKQNLQGERCAIEVYNKLLKKVLNKDMITSHLIRQILQEEIEHEQELEDLGNDFQLVLPSMACGCKKK